MTLSIASQVNAQGAQPDYLSGRWKFQGGNDCDAASHSEFRLEGNTGRVLTQKIIFDRSCEVYGAGYRTVNMYERIGDKVFQRWKAVQRVNVMLEYDGNVIIQTIGGSDKSYYVRQ